MPDFVYSTTANPFVNKFREFILPFECKSQSFFLGLDAGYWISMLNQINRPKNEGISAGHDQRKHY
jgi:hypothetical protein